MSCVKYLLTVHECVLADVGWLEYGNSIIKFYPEKVLPWTQAGTHCHNIGARLLALETLEKFELIKNLILTNEGLVHYSYYYINYASLISTFNRIL